MIFDVRNYNLRKHKYSETESIAHMPDKRNRVNETPINQEPLVKGTIMYIPLSELTQELDILKKVAELEVTVTLGQLFKWSPKARVEILKALTRKKKENDVTLLDTNVSIVRAVRTSSSKQVGDVPMGTVKINEELIDVPIDPGSRLNLMHINYANKRGLVWKSAKGRGRMADDRVSNFVGYIPNVKVDVDGVIVTQNFYIMETASFNVLLGMPWIAAAKCNLKWRDNQFWCSVASKLKKVSFVASIAPERWTTEEDHDDYEEEVDDEDDRDFMTVRRVHVDDCDEQDDLCIKVLSGAKNARTVKAYEVKPVNDDYLPESYCGKVVYWNEESEAGFVNDNKPEVIMRLTRDRINVLDVNREISLQDREYFEKCLLEKVPEVFAFDLSEIGRTNLIEYEVRTGGKEVPVTRVRPIRINNPARAQLFEEQLKEMLKNGLLEKGMGQFAYYCFPVNKKDSGTDQLRVVGDMRPLNKYIVKDGYLLPLIRDILENAMDHDWYSSVDAYKGYWQIQIREKDRDKVAVTTLLGVLRYTVMCMGLKNASKTFQRLMDIILAGDEWKDTAAVYQDDVGLWTNGQLKDHIDKFVELAQIFKQAGLTFAVKKCHLAYKELRMYGYIVGKNGMRVEPKRKELIEQWERPRCVRDVRSFLGVMNITGVL